MGPSCKEPGEFDGFFLGGDSASCLLDMALSGTRFT